MPNVQRILEERVTDAMRAAFPGADVPAIVVLSQDPKFGDYQANGAMALAKQLRRKPLDVAAEIVARLNVSDLCEKPEIAGPGFINLRLRTDWVSDQLGKINPDDRLGVEPAARPETVVVDYSAPNLAKEMHVGHLRSTIIGDALVRMLEFAKHPEGKVIRQNHVGDWGTQFGMLVEFLLVSGRLQIVGSTVVGPTMKDLEEFYKRAKARFDEDPEFARRARDRVVLLQQGNLLTRMCWQWFVTDSMDYCQEVYARLGALLTRQDVRGESAYNEVLPGIVETLREKRLLVESEGAQCVFLNDENGKTLFVSKDGDPLPLIVQKSDEGYLYATTDLAAIAFRTGNLPPPDNPQSAIRNPQSPRAGRILYVVDARQSLHFQMVFECARRAGFAPEGVRLEHIAFGTMMGPDGRPFKTRDGGTVKLMDLLDEAEKRAYDLVSAKSGDLSETERKSIARIVGIGAVKYADLSQNRTSDYIFSWDKMLSLDGNTAPYMQYAYARIRSIFRKGGHEAEGHRADAAAIALAAPQELALSKAVLRFPEFLDRALEDYRPNVLAAYLYDLAGAFTAFYDACPVIQSEEPVRSERLKLCDLTARVIHRGLALLGIETAERM